jgi:hypothetical protein
VFGGVPDWVRNAPAFIRQSFGYTPPVEATVRDAIADIAQAGTNTGKRTVAGPGTIDILAGEGVFFDPRGVRRETTGGGTGAASEAMNQQAARGPGGFDGPGGLEMAAQQIVDSTG